MRSPEAPALVGAGSELPLSTAWGSGANANVVDSN